MGVCTGVYVYMCTIQLCMNILRKQTLTPFDRHMCITAIAASPVVNVTQKRPGEDELRVGIPTDENDNSDHFANGVALESVKMCDTHKKKSVSIDRLCAC